MKYKQINIASLFTLLLSSLFFSCSDQTPQNPRSKNKLTDDWHFILADSMAFKNPDFDDAQWRQLDLPHDWSIEGSFDEKNLAGVGGGALPGGIGWYRKSFTVPASAKEQKTYIEFDGVYRNSEVWINGHSLGQRPNGYISFRYDLSPYLHFDGPNILAVRVDNSQQPNSRWYSGSGIYRNVWLTTTDHIHVDHWGTFVTTPEVTTSAATVIVKTTVANTSDTDQEVTLTTSIRDAKGLEIGQSSELKNIPKNTSTTFEQTLTVSDPTLWSIDHPQLYEVVSTVKYAGHLADIYQTPLGIRQFRFDADKGFFLNDQPLKILGVCNHHDLGCLGAAVNTRAIERQLEIMKAMGVNGIRTSHNPPAPELLDLCDQMGFIVMDEAFDIWAKKKNPFDYALDWKEWHQRDLQDLILRDRNHPSVFIWSIGNEVIEQYDKQDSSGTVIARELAATIKSLDPTRPITAACNDTDPLNPVIRSGALDLIGYNYKHSEYADFPKTYPGKCFIATETNSGLATRGAYDMPSDSIRRWPKRWDLPLTEGNADHTVSSYDNVSAPWGSLHSETWPIVKKYDFLSGMYIWTGFDYLGEPTPYGWPSRSSYFGIVDLAGFPKDAFYYYQSEWTREPVLHLFPHWNWPQDKAVDVWAYTNCEEVELFLNGRSLGVKQNNPDEAHLVWRVNFQPGTLKAIGRSGGQEVLVKEIHTAGEAKKITLAADRNKIKADGTDLSFVTVKIEDANGSLVPDAANPVTFAVEGPGFIAGVDNGNQTSMESFKALQRKAFNGLCLAVIQSNGTTGKIRLRASSAGLESSVIEIEAR